MDFVSVGLLTRLAVSLVGPWEKIGSFLVPFFTFLSEVLSAENITQGLLVVEAFLSASDFFSNSGVSKILFLGWEADLIAALVENSCEVVVVSAVVVAEVVVVTVVVVDGAIEDAEVVVVDFSVVVEDSKLKTKGGRVSLKSGGRDGTG